MSAELLLEFASVTRLRFTNYPGILDILPLIEHALVNLEYLDISSNPLTNDHILDIGSASITELNVSDTRISTHGLLTLLHRTLVVFNLFKAFQSLLRLIVVTAKV